MKLPITSIHFGKRQRGDLGNIAELVEDMRENGQYSSVTVRPPRQDEIDAGITEPWVLMAGGRRLTAAMLLGWEEIEALPREDMSALKARTIELHENLKRKALTMEEEVFAKQELWDLRQAQNPNITLAEVAAELGESNANLSRDLATAKALEANPSLRKAGTKKAVLNASKILKQQKLRLDRIRATNTGGPQGVISIGHIEDRVVTARAEEWLPSLSARSVDLALLDGPYGYNYWKGGQKLDLREQGTTKSLVAEYDDDPERTGELYRLVFPEIVRVVRETGWLVFFCGEETYEFLSELATDCCATHAAYRSSTYPAQCNRGRDGLPGSCRFLVAERPGWIWYRPNSRNNPRFRQLHAKNVYERILVINMGHAQIVRWPCFNVLVHDNLYGGRVHANEKPITLYRDIIERLTFSGDTVLDCFYGSGNSLAAAGATSRNFLGCDANPSMRQFALARVTEHYQPISAAEVRKSLERYERGVAMDLEGIDDFSEEPEEELVVENESHAQMVAYLAQQKELQETGVVV